MLVNLWVLLVHRYRHLPQVDLTPAVASEFLKCRCIMPQRDRSLPPVRIIWNVNSMVETWHNSPEFKQSKCTNASLLNRPFETEGNHEFRHRIAFQR